MKNNIRKIMNIMGKGQKENISMVLVLLDAERAFNRIEWPHLKKAIDRFEVGSYFEKWLDILYKE